MEQQTSGNCGSEPPRHATRENSDGYELQRARDEALAGTTGNSIVDAYERMAIQAAWDDHTTQQSPNDRARRLAHASALAADAKFGTNMAAKFADHQHDTEQHCAPTRGSTYFYDTEFHWYANTIDLISIAIVSDDGREFYAHTDQYNYEAASNDPFLATHVLPALRCMPPLSVATLRADLDTFLNPRPTQLWADFGAWDQVALMQIWGGMGDQPEWLPMQTRDVRLFASLLGRKLPDYPAEQHDALVDARHVRSMFSTIEPDLQRAAQMFRIW